MTEFNIGSQQGVNISNIGGNAYIGEQGGTQVPEHAFRDLADVRRALVSVRGGAEAGRAVDELEGDLREGNAEQAASRFDGLVQTLQRTGALAAAGASLAEPLTRLATWLGTVIGRPLPW